MAAIEVEETIRRIASHKGVEGIVVCNMDGVSLKSTLSKELSTQYAGLMTQLATKARSVLRTIDADDDLVFLRARTKKHEVMVAPGDGYMLIVRAPTPPVCSTFFVWPCQFLLLLIAPRALPQVIQKF